MNYIVSKANLRPELTGEWDSPAWQQAQIADIANFRPESSTHHPVVKVKLLHADDGVFGIFKVQDCYVRAVRTNFQDSVCRDSCVEFFVKPKQDQGYFNFEFNCGGTFLSSYITDHTRTPNGFAKYTMLTPEQGQMISVFHSLPATVEPEITEPTEWTLEFFIPFTLFATYVGPLGDCAGQQWTANFYKCADETSHPHWVSWSPINKLNYHLPDCFGNLIFE